MPFSIISFFFKLSLPVVILLKSSQEKNKTFSLILNVTTKQTVSR